MEVQNHLAGQAPPHERVEVLRAASTHAIVVLRTLATAIKDQYPELAQQADEAQTALVHAVNQSHGLDS
jgi:hypothetical protein